jgi:hypothetical protein
MGGNYGGVPAAAQDVDPSLRDAAATSGDPPGRS